MLFRTSILVALLLCAGLATAQKNPAPKDDFEISDIPEEESHPYFGVGGGFCVTFLGLNYDDINTLTGPLQIPKLSGAMMLTGGSGFISAPFGKNLRIGGAGWGGNASQCADVNITDSNGTFTVRRTAELTLGGGGLTLEWVYPFAFTKNRLVVTAGALLGVGSIAVTLNQVTADSMKWSTFGDGGSNYTWTRQIHSNYFAYQPYVNLECSVFAFMMLRASIGYNGTVTGTFTQDRDVAIQGVPKINGNGLVYGGGVFLGIFR